MSAMSIVVVSSDLRRVTVKATPGTFLIDVLNEACRKLNLPSDKYLLKHKARQLDLTNPVRTSSLSPGAKLDLVVKSSSPTVINVALKLPDADAAGLPNGRLVGKFRSDTTLWQMLRQFESGAASGMSADTGVNRPGLNFTARGVPRMTASAEATARGTLNSGQLYYEGPALLVVGREVSSLADFQKTLSQLGISSNVSMHLSFKQTGQTLHEAMQQIEQFFKEAEPEAAGQPAVEPFVVPPSTAVTAEAVAAVDRGAEEEQSTAATSASPSPLAAASKIAAVAQPLQAASESSSGSHHGLRGNAAPRADRGSASTDRAMQVFAAPTSSTPAAALTDEPDSTYEPTIAHAQLHQQRLLENSHNKRLPSDKEIAERAAAEEAKIAAVSDVSVKVRFPDNTSAQWRFTPNDTAASLYNEVRALMANPDLPFKLVSQAAARPELQDSAGEGQLLIRDYRLEGRVVATVIWADDVPSQSRKVSFLKEAAAGQARQIPVPVPLSTEGQKDSASIMAPPKAVPGPVGDGGSAGVKIPKWLKLPGKK